MRFRAVLPPLAPVRGASTPPADMPDDDPGHSQPSVLSALRIRSDVRPGTRAKVRASARAEVRSSAPRGNHLTAVQLARPSFATPLVAAVALAASMASSVASAARDPDAAQWPVSQPAHRAIFCGEPDTQTGFEYATALNGAINQLTRTGRSVPQAIDVLRGRARCAAGSELPDLASKAAPVATPSLIGTFGGQP